MATPKNLFGPATNVAKAVAPTPSNNPWQPVLSFGQTLIDIASTPLYFVEGAIAGAQKGKNPIVSAAENSVAWTQGKRPQTGSDVLKNAGMSNDFWSSLAADIALDPLTYTPGVFVSAPIKAILAAGKGAAKGLSAAAKLEVSAASAGAKSLGKTAEALVSVPRIKKSPTSAAQLEKQLGTQEKMGKYVYQPVSVAPGRSASEAMYQMLASSAEAGYKSARMSLDNSFLKESVRKISKAENKAARRGESILAPEVLAAEGALATEKAATNVAKDVPTPAIVAAADAQTKKAPSLIVTETAPKPATPLEVAAISTPDAAKTRAQIKRNLTKVDKLIADTTGVAASKEKLISAIKSITSKETADVYNFYNKLEPVTRQLLVDSVKRTNGLNILDTLRKFAAGSKQQQSVVDTIAERVITDSSGNARKVKDILASNEFARPYNEIDATLRQNLQAVVARNIQGSGSAAAAEQLNYKTIEDIVGSKVAKQIKDTNALHPELKTDNTKFEKILNAINSNTERKYSGMDSLVAGLRSGDVIDSKRMQQILKLIDPEHKLVSTVEDGVKSKLDSRALASALINEGANSIGQAKHMLDMLDPESYFEATHIGFKDFGVALMHDILAGRGELDKAATMQTQLEAANRLLKYEKMGMGAYVRDAAQSFGRGLANNYGAIYKGIENETAGVSKLNDIYIAVRGNKEGPEAVIASQYNQHLETYVLGSVLGKETWRRDKAITEAAKKGLEKDFKTSRMDDLKLRLAIVKDVALATSRVRPVHVKAIGKLRGGVEDYYHHYIMFGDVAELMSKYKLDDLFNKMMFIADDMPKGGFNRNMDWVSPQAIGNAISDILQGAERGTPVDLDALAKAIATPAPKKSWTPQFQKVMDDASKELVTFLSKGNVVEDMKNIHISNLKAETSDLAHPAQLMSADMVESLYEAYAAMKAKGIGTMAERHRLVHTWMLKFATNSRIFGLSNGEVARAVFRSTANMFLDLTNINKSGLASEWRDMLNLAAAQNSKLGDMYPDFMNALTSAYKWDTTDVFTVPNVTKPQLEKATNDLVAAKDGFDKSVKQLAADLTPSQALDWRKKHEAIQQGLIKARDAATKLGIQTEHWNGETWVASERYNHTEAVANAAKSRSRYLITEEGRIDLLKWMTDTEVKTPTYKKFGVKHTKATKAMWEEQRFAKRAKKGIDNSAQAAENAVNAIPTIEKMLPDNELAQVDRINQEQVYGDINSNPIEITQEVNNPDLQFFGASNYREAINGTNVDGTITKQAGLAKTSVAAEKAQAGAGMNDVASVLNGAQSTLYNAIGDADAYLKSVVTYFRKNKMSPEDLQTALSKAVSKETIPNSATDAVAELSRQLQKLVDTFLEHAKTRGLAVSDLAHAFKLRGVSRWLPASLDEFSGPDGLTQLLQMLPINAEPEQIVRNLTDADPNIKAAAKVALENWKDLRDKFARESLTNKDALSGISLLHNVFSAISFTSSKMNIVDSLTSKFNYVNDFPHLSPEAALKAARKSGDYVVVQPLKGTGHSLTELMGNTAEKGNYFHKDIAKQIFALERSFNYTFEKALAPWLKNMMGVLGFFKATQTILRPGHLVANMLGDMSAALMAGASPRDIFDAAKIAMKYAGPKVEADWFKSGADARWSQMASSMQALRKEGREVKTADNGIVVVAGGKAITLDNETTIGGLRDSNVLVGDIQANDSLMQYNELEATAAVTSQEAQLQKNLLQKISTGINKATVSKAYTAAIKPAGDVVAYMGNIPRTATALRVMRSQSWDSLDQMWAAVNKEINTMHPTIQSLSAVERKNPRLIFTYYTWLRGAHNAFIKLATEHTASMLIPSKMFYNQSLANEMGPGSIGNLWGNKQDTPDYLNYSVYGPTMAGPRGAMLYRPSILPLDVLDTWNISYDSSKALDQNAFNNLQSVARNVVGRNINLLAQPAIELVTGTDIGTGKPSTIKDLKTAGEDLFSNIGTSQLFKGLGLYTPSNKGPESANPLTPRDREVILQNYFFGLRQADVYTPANIKYGEQDNTARMTRLFEQLQGKTNQ